MNKHKEQMMRLIKRKAEQDAAYLAGEFVRAAQAEREEILAAMEFEQWLARNCAECLEDHQTC